MVEPADRACSYGLGTDSSRIQSGASRSGYALSPAAWILGSFVGPDGKAARPYEQKKSATIRRRPIPSPPSHARRDLERLAQEAPCSSR